VSTCEKVVNVLIIGQNQKNGIYRAIFSTLLRAKYFLKQHTCWLLLLYFSV